MQVSDNASLIASKLTTPVNSPSSGTAFLSKGEKLAATREPPRRTGAAVQLAFRPSPPELCIVATHGMMSKPDCLGDFRRQGRRLGEPSHSYCRRRSAHRLRLEI